MKKFRVDGFKFSIIPMMIIGIMIIYGVLFFNETPTYINVINITLDIILLIIYFRIFIYDINIDSQGINFKGIFIEKRVLISDMKYIKQGGVLTLIKTEKGRFLLLTFKNDMESLKNIFKDV